MEDGDGEGDATGLSFEIHRRFRVSEELTEIEPRGVISATQIRISQ
jgi:hypothetical protein